MRLKKQLLAASAQTYLARLSPARIRLSMYHVYGALSYLGYLCMGP